jgi:hypothetical protein
MEQKRNYIICTGSPDENPNKDYTSDESDYYELGVREYDFYGTLDEAREKGAELANKREERDYRRHYISVSYWIKDENGTFY